MNQKKIIIFMPFINGGGVEKNFFLITNYLSTKFKDISVISLSKSYRNKLSPKIKFVTFKTKLPSTIGRRTKYIISLFLLFKKILFNQNSTVFCFQGLAYCTILCKLLSRKISIRSNSSPSGWSNNYIKKILYKKIYSMADKIIVNSEEFRKELKLKFNLNSECIYNPLNKKEITKSSEKKVNFSFYKKNHINFINMGRLVDQKDQLTILKAFKFLKEKTDIKFKLLILGNGVYKKKFSEFTKTFISLFGGLKEIELSSKLANTCSTRLPTPSIFGWVLLSEIISNFI